MRLVCLNHTTMSGISTAKPAIIPRTEPYRQTCVKMARPVAAGTAAAKSRQSRSRRMPRPWPGQSVVAMPRQAMKSTTFSCRRSGFAIFAANAA